NQQRLLKPAVEFLGEDPAPIKQVAPVSTGQSPEGEVDFASRECLLVEEQTGESQGGRRIIFGLEDRLWELSHVRVLGEQKVHETILGGSEQGSEDTGETRRRARGSRPSTPDGRTSSARRLSATKTRETDYEQRHLRHQAVSLGGSVGLRRPQRRPGQGTLRR